MSKTAQAIKSGVVMGGTAILSAVNGLTPHMAGAIDIMVVQQPDGSLKCSPFYVRFGKYTPMRSKDKKVQIFVNGEEACFNMHLGAYGQAYFAAETMEIVSDADDELLTGMMSPSSGYSSDDEEGTPYANASMLSAVQQEVARLQAAKAAADADAVGAAGDAVTSPAAAVGEGPLQTSSSAGVSADGSRQRPSGSGNGGFLSPTSQAPLSGTESDGETSSSSSSSSSSSLSDLPSPADVAAALQEGLAAAGAGGTATAVVQQFDLPLGLPPIITANSNGNAAAVKGGKRRGRKTVGARVLQVSGDGAAGDPARSRLQDLLLDNKYSLKMQSDASFAAGQQQQREQRRQRCSRSLEKRQDGDLQQSQQQQQQDDGVQEVPLNHHQRLQELESMRLPSDLPQQQQQAPPVRHVGFQLPPSPLPQQQQQQQQEREKASAAATRAAQAAGAAAANGIHKVHASELPVLLDSTASYSMDEVSEATGLSSASLLRRSVSAGGASIVSVNGPDMSAAADTADTEDTAGTAAAAAAAHDDADAEGTSGVDTSSSSSSSSSSSVSGSMQPQPTLADGLPAASIPFTTSRSRSRSGSPLKRQTPPAALQVDQQQQLRSLDLCVQHSPSGRQSQDEQIVSPNRASLLSSSLKAQQQMDAAQQQQQQEEGSKQQRDEQLLPQLQRSDSPQPAAARSPAATTPEAAPVEQQQQRSPSLSSPVTSQEAAEADGDAVDATAILDDAAAVTPSGWDIHTHTGGDASAQQAVSSQPSQQPSQSSSSSNSSATQQVVLSPAPAADTTSAGGASAQRSEPVSMPFVASPPVDSGYLGDSEAGALLGTSYETATPRRAAAAAAMAAEGVSGPGAGPLALGLAGFQLSLCGALLRPGIMPAEAQQVFETRRVSGQVWSEQGVTLMQDPDLVVRIGGNLYSWQVAAPMVVGMLAFGGKWDSLLGLDPTGMYPIKVAEDHAVTAKKSSVSSSWRLWPFTGWREPASLTKQQQQSQQQQTGSSPSQTLPPAAAAASASTSALQPSGGSFTNLRALLAPGSKSAPDRTGYNAAGAEEGSVGGAGAAGGVSGGGAELGVAAGGSRNASFVSTGSSPPRVSRKKHIILIRKTLTPTSEQLSLLPLRPGANTITFRAGGAADLTAYIYLLRWNTRLVVSDVDGTITRSDLLGHVLPTLGVDWSHPGITQLFHNIARNGYQIMFLSSRAIAQANITREYLHTLVQNDYKMPSGPVIISPHGLLPSLYREIVVRRPHEFKIACLQDIRALFPTEWNPFYAGFGNRDTDEVAYREVGVPLSRTFTINPKGQIQKASTAVQSSTWSSLSAINDLVDEMFPALLQHTASSISRGLHSTYTSFTETLELAASLGAIGQEIVAAVFAEQQRRRSSSTGGSGDGGGTGGTAAAAKAAAAAGTGASGNGDGVLDSSGQKQQQGTEEDAAVAAPMSPLAAAAAAAAAAADDAAALGGAQAGAGGLLLENVGPAREEYNDLHFWRPSMYVDVGDEIAAFSAKQPQPAS